MKKGIATRSLAAAACGVVALTGTAGVTTSASEYEHPAVVTENPVDWTPDLLPDVTARPVAYSVAEADDQMVVGGRFGAVDANPGAVVEQKNVVALDATDGVINTGFDPVVNGQVWSVVSDGTSVYLGGKFTTVNGVTRPALAKVSLATGELDPPSSPATRVAESATWR